MHEIFMHLQVMGSLLIVKIFECLNIGKMLINSINSIVLLKHWVEFQTVSRANKQFQFMTEIACFNSVFKILKFQDASAIHFQVPFFQT